MSKFALLAQHAKKALPYLRAVSGAWLGFHAYHSGAQLVVKEFKLPDASKPGKEVFKLDFETKPLDDMPRKLTRTAIGFGVGAAFPILPVAYGTFRAGTWAFVEPTFKSIEHEADCRVDG